MKTFTLIIEILAALCLIYKVISTAYNKNIDASIGWALSLIYFIMLIIKY